MAKLAPNQGQDVVGKGVPLGRMGEKWEMGMAALFLASEGAG